MQIIYLTLQVLISFITERYISLISEHASPMIPAS